MLRSLYSGVSGMKVNQLKMDVIGNNIANVGTTAFKAGRTRFQDMLSQSSKSAMAPMTTSGGVNPSQVGLGVQLAGIDTIVTQGTMQSTGSNLDVAIDGDGYFMVGKGPQVYSTTNSQITVDSTGTGASHEVTKNGGMDISYTRDGSFTLDSDGNLLTSDGYRVLGYSLNQQAAPTSATGMTSDGLTYSFGTGTELNGYTFITATAAAPGSVVVAPGTKTITINEPAGTAASTIQTSLNAALAGVGIKTSITVSGSMTAGGVTSGAVAGGTGGTYPARISDAGSSFFVVPGAGAELNGYNISVTSSGAATSSATINQNASPKTIVIDFAAGDTTANLQSLLDSALSSNGISTPITLAGTPTAIGATAISGGVDATLVHSLDGTSAAPVINFVDGSKAVKADDTMLKTLKIPDKVTTASGATLRVKTYSISKDGIISAVLEDGSISDLGQIAMASFKNPAGLEKTGGNLYTQSSNSGVAVIRTGTGAAAADDNSKGYGDQVEGMLEMSNVDLAEQFTDMIVTSRAFQASGKMISTGDEMLQDIINLKR